MAHPCSGKICPKSSSFTHQAASPGRWVPWLQRCLWCRVAFISKDALN